MTNALVYTMGIVASGTSRWSVIGVPSRTIYKDYPGKIDIHEHGEVTGSYSAQVLELMRIAAQQKYYPLAIALELFRPDPNIIQAEGRQYLIPLFVSARIQFCIDTSYIIRPLFYQTKEIAKTLAPDKSLKAWNLYTDEPGATRHAITFLRKAKKNKDLRQKAWGDEH